MRAWRLAITILAPLAVMVFLGGPTVNSVETGPLLAQGPHDESASCVSAPTGCPAAGCISHCSAVEADQIALQVADSGKVSEDVSQPASKIVTVALAKPPPRLSL